MRCALALLAALCPAGPALAQGQGLGTFCNGRLAVDSARSEPLADGAAVQHVLQLRNLLPFPLRYQLPESPMMAASIPDLTPPPSPAPPSVGGPALPGLGGGGAAVTGPGGGG
ncbi:MAG: hypothetical protein K2X11_21940, partial [Acetobacteraceae bacterium]|nr:hypothetical protein [Acetobacteraceae bacterium]